MRKEVWPAGLAGGGSDSTTASKARRPWISSYGSLSLNFPYLKSQDEARGVVWYTPVTPALERQRQEDLSQVSLGCV